MRSDNNVVAPDGPPLVMTNGELNSWKAFTRFVIVLKKMTGVIYGSCTLMNILHLEAPSIVAASMIDEGTPLKAARKITMVAPNCQTCSKLTTHRAEKSPANQAFPCIPINARRLLIRPFSENMYLQRIEMATLPPMSEGI